MITLGVASGPPVERHNYTTMHVDALEAYAEHGLIGTVVGAVEIAAAMFARAFSVASVEPAIPALSPEVLATIARRLISRGESLHVIHADGGRIELVESSDWSLIAGGPRPATWRYQATTSGPHSTPTVYTGSPGVVHCRYATSAYQPWIGLSPLTLAGVTGRLARNLEAALKWETQGAADGQAGSLIPTPQDASDKATEAEDPLAPLKATLRGLKGRVGLVETTAQGYAEGRAGAPQDDWRPRRIGPDPPAALAELRRAVEETVLSCCGIPPGLARVDGGESRESYRRWFAASVLPMAALVQAELQHKLDVPDLRLGFRYLAAADVHGRSRAWRSLVGTEASIPDAEARAMVGLDA
ncbi:MAG: hypothetical protein OXG04_01835 [Acidobacteria bacterium]|nr:hypothetical protein [Acidobacteriota bacterium]